MSEPVYTFERITDPQVFDTAAAVMAATDPWITLEMDQSRCRGAFEGNEKEIYGAYDGTVLAGFAVIQTGGSFRGYIQTLCATPDYRGKGVGTFLLQHCEQCIHQFSPNVFMCVSSFNTAAQQLYFRYGFEQAGLLKDFVKKGYDELLLRKTTGPWNEFTKKG